jgi:CheY-like chemotaxis protein/GAF domain-containing protein
MTEKTELRKLLVLDGPGLEAQGLVDLFRPYFQVQVVDELDEALEAMRRTSFDAVLAETADFLPLERGIVTQQASVILDTIGDGVCIVGPGGELAWANRRLKEAPAGVLDSLRDLCAKAYEELAVAAETAEAGKRFSLMPGDGSYYEVICSPVRDRNGLLRQVAAVVVNATGQRRQQMKLNAIERAGRELVRLDGESLSGDAAARLRVLEERIIRCSRDVLNFQHFAVLVLNLLTNELELIFSQGMPEVRARQLFANPEGNGICGYVAATGRSYICPDVRNDRRYLQGMEGARSTLTVPLRLHDKVVGVLNVESDRTGAFGEEDRQFAEMFANHVALALSILNLLVFERHSASTQVSGSIAAELSGPINDILTDASELMEDYIGLDDLRARLSGVIDSATKAGQTLHRLSHAPCGMAPDQIGSASPDALLSGKRVLVADDEDLICQTIRDVLVQRGCNVDAVSDGATAREMIARSRYDLVISDIKMPGATGYEVFAAAREGSPEAKVILITGFGYDPHHSIVRANREGLAAVLMKPFRVKQLLDACRAALSPKAAS